MADGDTRELLLMWVRAEDGEIWLEETIDLLSADATYISECRSNVHGRAAEYKGQVAELRVRLPVALMFTEPPLVEAEVVHDGWRAR